MARKSGLRTRCIAEWRLSFDGYAFCTSRFSHGHAHGLCRARIGPGSGTFADFRLSISTDGNAVEAREAEGSASLAGCDQREESKNLGARGRAGQSLFSGA